MTKKEIIDEIVSQKTFAIAGMSRTGRKFGNDLAKELKRKGKSILPFHPSADDILGEKSYKTFEEMPQTPDAIIIVLPSRETEKVCRLAHQAGINRIWIQQGCDTPEAINFCKENGITFVSGECLLMFLEPLGMVHGFHKFLWKVIGKYPK